MEKTNVQPNPDDGIIKFDVPDEVWNDFTVQGQVAFVVHNLIDFMAMPQFHLMNGMIMQVRRPGIIFPTRTFAAFGLKPHKGVQ